MNKYKIMLTQLENQLQFWQEAHNHAPRPKQGWVRTIRKALGMTITQLAYRLNVNPSRVVKIETSEIEGSITLKALQEAAKALKCEFVYAFVPKKTLKDILLERAEKVIKGRIDRVSHSMALEKQSVSKERQIEQFEEALRSIFSKPRQLNSLWNIQNEDKVRNNSKVRKRKERRLKK